MDKRDHALGVIVDPVIGSYQLQRLSLKLIGQALGAELQDAPR
jgi:hypothetical protein